MRKCLLTLLTLALVACGKEPKTGSSDTQAKAATPEALGKEIFEGKGNCVACHLPDKTSVGPSIIAIANAYKGKKGAMAAFLNEEGDPIVDPEKYAVMKTNFAITKAMTAEEREALESYVSTYAQP